MRVLILFFLCIQASFAEDIGPRDISPSSVEAHLVDIFFLKSHRNPSADLIARSRRRVSSTKIKKASYANQLYANLLGYKYNRNMEILVINFRVDRQSKKCFLYVYPDLNDAEIADCNLASRYKRNFLTLDSIVSSTRASTASIIDGEHRKVSGPKRDIVTLPERIKGKRAVLQ